MNIFIELPFRLCVIFLQVLGKCLHLTYKEISVVFNLYFQGIVLFVSGLFPFICSVWRMIMFGCGWISIALLIITLLYFSIYVVGGIWMLRHYHGPMDSAFDRCVDDLEDIADRWGVSYYAANIVIFILWYMAILGINVALSFLLVR